jgi:hypothetical protein
MSAMAIERTHLGFLPAMILVGAIGFHLVIDIPPLPFHPAGSQADHDARRRIDAAGFPSAFVSVSAVVPRAHVDPALTGLIMAGWLGRVVIQIGAGAMVRRLRRR